MIWGVIRSPHPREAGCRGTRPAGSVAQANDQPSAGRGARPAGRIRRAGPGVSPAGLWPDRATVVRRAVVPPLAAHPRQYARRRVFCSSSNAARVTLLFCRPPNVLPITGSAKRCPVDGLVGRRAQGAISLWDRTLFSATRGPAGRPDPTVAGRGCVHPCWSRCGARPDHQDQLPPSGHIPVRTLEAVGAAGRNIKVRSTRRTTSRSVPSRRWARPAGSSRSAPPVGPHPGSCCGVARPASGSGGGGCAFLGRCG